ncbi:MAG: GNAT family N-acetyltransferase [Mogibacterium sp.]|nr:GNAT family N-acetyltransferase [Mogibacterium sp.]
MFDKYPYLKNDIAICRKMSPEDAERLDAITKEASVYRTLPTFLYELKYPDKKEVIRRMDEECFDTGQSVLLGIYPADEPEVLAGIAEIYNYEAYKKKASIGYRIDESFSGRGLASAAAELLTGYLLNEEGLRTVTAHVLSDNAASARVLRKNGFIKKYPGRYEDWGFDELMLTDTYVRKAVWGNNDIDI